MPFGCAAGLSPSSRISTMSMETIATLRRMSREQLSELILSDASKVAVVDVRDDDHVGGHIHGSTHVPSSTLDYRIPEIVRVLADRQIVVFHCALSQQRGPTAALRYMRERENKVKKGELGSTSERPELGVKDGDVQKVLSNGKDQEIYVLDKGFVGWQEKYDLALSSIFKRLTNILLIGMALTSD